MACRSNHGGMALVASMVAMLGCASSSASSPGLAHSGSDTSMSPREDVVTDVVLDDTPVAEPGDATAMTDPVTTLPVTTPRGWTSKEPTVVHARTRAIVLMYHSVGAGITSRSVSTRMFESHLQWLRDNHIEVVPLSAFVAYLDGKLELPERVAVITIDDGEKSFYKNAFPSLVKFEMPFALGLPTMAIEQSNERPTLTWDLVREIMSSGLCEIASHSHTHPNLAKLSPRALRNEFTTSRDLIEKNTGVRPASVFYPMGSFNRAVLDVAAEVYQAGFVAVGAPVKPTTSRFRIPRYEMSHEIGVVRLASFARRAGLDVRDPMTSAPRKMLATR